jgi:hypothetical protein
MMMKRHTMKMKIGRRRAVIRTQEFQAALTLKISRKTQITASPFTSITILAESAGMWAPSLTLMTSNSHLVLRPSRLTATVNTPKSLRSLAYRSQPRTLSSIDHVFLKRFLIKNARSLSRSAISFNGFLLILLARMTEVAVSESVHIFIALLFYFRNAG